MLKVAVGKQTAGRTQVLEWFFKSKSNIISVEDEQLGCPLLDKHVNSVKQLVLKNRGISIHDDAYMLEISFGSGHSILKCNLHMCLVPAKFVPRLPSEEQKNHVNT
jgi:hypothetical protein